jgi:hypothetical protein
MKQRVNGPALLAAAMVQAAEKTANNKGMCIGQMTEEGQIIIGAQVIDIEDYMQLNREHMPDLHAGDDVILFRPDESYYILLGKIT